MALALVALLAGCERAPASLPVARDGLIDLSAHDFKRQGPVALNGQWEIHADKLLPPGDFDRPADTPRPTGYVRFPGVWKAPRPQAGPSNPSGQATFRLRVLPGPGEQRLMLRLVLDTPVDYALWVDGVLLASCGFPGLNVTVDEPNPFLVLAELTSHGAPLNVTLWLSSPRSRPVGVRTPILLGTPEILQRRHLRVWGASLLMAGSVLAMGLFHLVLFFLRRRNRAYLYFCLLCLVWVGYFVCGEATQWVVYLFYSDIDPWLLHTIYQSCYLVARCVGYRFLRGLYPEEFSRFFQHVSDGVAVVFGSILWIFPRFFSERVIHYSFAFTIAILVYSVWRLVVCARKGRDAALLILLGYGAMGLAGITVMLCHAGFLDPALLPRFEMSLQIGLLLYVLAQAQALAQRFSMAFSRVKSLSTDLERQNEALGREMAERNRLERKVVHTTEQERRRISHEIHDGLCQHLTGARLHCSILEDQLGAGPAAMHVERLGQLLDISVNDAYDLSRGLWPVEHDPNSPGPSFEALVRRVAETSGVEVELRERLRCPACANPHATPLYRIAQEALVNAVKHAKASRIQVSLTCVPPGRLVLSVVDNGVGLGDASDSRGGLGMEIMNHRARIIEADLEIRQAPGGGVEVRCVASCPVSPAMPRDDET